MMIRATGTQIHHTMNSTFSVLFIFFHRVSTANTLHRSDSIHVPHTASGGLSVHPASISPHCSALGSAGADGKPVGRSLALHARCARCASCARWASLGATGCHGAPSGRPAAGMQRGEPSAGVYDGCWFCCFAGS